MGSSNAKSADIENGPYSPLRNKTLADAWAEHTWSNGKPGLPGGIRASQYVQPRQQIKRDFDEAQRVASMFEYLEHIDDDLSWDGLQAAAQAAIRPWRIFKTVILLGPFLLFTLTAEPKKMKNGRFHHISPHEHVRTLLTHASAASLSYLILGFLFQVLTMLALRFARRRGLRKAEMVLYLNGILFKEERAACSVICAWAVNFSWWSPPQETRILLARPCVCILLLLFCNALKKILEFSFLRSKLALNFESDVLVNAFELAALERVADFACLEEQPKELTQTLQQTPVLPLLQDPHAFEKLTAEHLRKAYGKGQKVTVSRLQSTSNVLRTQAPAAWLVKVSRAPELFRALQNSSTTMFFMRMEGKFADIEDAARRVFAKLVGQPDPATDDLASDTMTLTEGSDAFASRKTSEKAPEPGKGLSFTDILSIMPTDDANMTWQLLTGRSGAGEVFESDWTSAVRGAFERFHMIAATVKDYAAIWLVFSNVVYVVQLILSSAIILGTFFPAEVLRTLCISMSTVALGLSFIFGNLLKEIFESVVLLLVMHPYDVGDRIQLGDGDALRIYTVQKINIMTTEVRDLANHCIYLKNNALYNEASLVNLGRSLNAVVEIGVTFQTSEMSSTVSYRINQYVNLYVQEHAHAWVPSYVRSFSPVERGRANCDLAGAVTHCVRIMHRQPWQNIRDIRRDTTELMYKILGQLHSWGVDFRNTPQPVHIETNVSKEEADGSDKVGASPKVGVELLRTSSQDLSYSSGVSPAYWARLTTGR